MATVELAVEVNAPIWRVYQNWKRFEQFPRYAKRVREVRPTGNRLFWREEHEGTEYEAVFEVTLQLQENRLLWRSISGADNSGVARFDPVKNASTNVTLTMEYEPGIGWQSPAAISTRLRGYLTGFKEFIEAADAG